MQGRIRGLGAGRTYRYRFLRGTARSDVGSFRTAPSSRADATVEFAWTGDTDFQRAAGQSTPFWNNGEVFRRMRSERNHFNIHLGDTIYSDTEVPPPTPQQPFPVALTVRDKWGKYKQNLNNRNLRSLRGAAGFYSHWDDHEFINDFSQRENTFANAISGITETIDGPTLYRRGVKAFTDYSPVTYSRANGIYRSVRWGRNLELFFLDERSFRDAKADEGGVCNNPETGEPDLAPTGPQDKRELFSVIAPSLKQPVSPACLAKIRDPNRDFLGDSQYRRFTRAIARSKARFKVVMNEMPIQQYYALPYDRWEGYEAERQRLLTFLSRNVKNVIFLTTDVHATLVNDARFQTLEPGGPKNSGIWDYTVGPAATANFALEIDEVTSEGAGAALRAAFLEPKPPAGVGMRCSVVDKFSYGQVKVTARALTVTSKGIDGRPLAGCKPLVLRYKR
ncbi:MAG TPA: alkaline phosphatase D family protein [Polyangiaceae bacterium]|nr:alkaline phosphatase D family protein [Polyangiaceae bacterium]